VFSIAVSSDCKDLKCVAEQLAVCQREEEVEQKPKFAGQKFIMGNQLHIKWIKSIQTNQPSQDQCCALVLCTNVPHLLSSKLLNV